MSGLLELLRPENLEQFERDGLRVRILTKGGLAVELGPNQDPEDLPKPPSLAGARLRRKVPLDSLTKGLRTELARVTRVLERRVERELRRSGILARLEADAAKREKRGPIGRGGIPLGPERELALERTFRLDGMEAVARLFADEETAFQLELESVLGDSYEEFFNRGGSAARVELGARGNFKLTNTAIADALKARANKLAGDIAEDVFDRLKTVIADQFYLEGRGIADVARALREEFDWLTKTRSDRIARTETLSVTEEAQHTVYKASGIHFKRWITTLDGKERPSHFEAHGQIRAIDEAFDVGDSTLMWPGDPDAPPEEICNCRCATQPIVTADQLFSDADIWRGDVDPDEFAKDREEPRDELTRGPSAPPPSDTEDLEFGDEEPPDEGEAESDEKRSPWAADGPVILEPGTSLDWRTISVDLKRIKNQDLRAIEKWLKAEREYERDDRGRFGSGSSGATPKPESKPRERVLADSPEVPSTVEGLPPAVARQMLILEHVFTENDFETAAIVDKDGNRVMVQSQGHPSQVSFTKDEIAKVRGNYFTHNHPSSRSFSLDDIRLSATHGPLEMRAAGNDGTVYRMSSPRGEVWPSAERVSESHALHDRGVQAEFMLRIERGELSVADANREHAHEVWTRVSKDLGLNYSRDESRAGNPVRDREATSAQREQMSTDAQRAAAAAPRTEPTMNPGREAAIDRFRRQYGAQIRPERGTR